MPVHRAALPHPLGHGRLLSDGKVRAIGVSNFMPEHLQKLLERSTVVPAVNQIELHPYFIQQATRAIDASHGILPQAWSPIGGIAVYRGNAEKSTLNDPVILASARAHGGPEPDSVILETYGRPIPEAKRRRIVGHSPDGLDWG